MPGGAVLLVASSGPGGVDMAVDTGRSRMNDAYEVAVRLRFWRGIQLVK